MSRLRGNPNGHPCSVHLYADWKGGVREDRGMCQDPAAIRCNRCRGYFCEECWSEHLEYSVNTTDDVPDGLAE